jgi:peptidoglycan/xylan/chitin deacetylase (PgdA/CDA1 family)
MRKKSMLRHALHFTGVMAARWRSLARGLYVFNYHRIGNPLLTAYNRGIFSCSAERFEEHLIILKERFEVISLDRLDHDSNGCKSRRPLALITFDDGYIDNYQIAFTLLRKQGLSAVFFLPTSFIGTACLPWWEELPWLLRHAPHRELRLAGWDKPFPLTEGERSIRMVMDALKRRNVPMKEQTEEVREACGGIRPPAGDVGQLFLNWDQAREMRAGGMDLGSHTHTHRILSSLSAEEQYQELEQSRAVLEAELQDQVTAVAYPVGGPTSYTQETSELALKAGYRAGFNFLRRTNQVPLSNRLDIARLAVDGNMNSRELQALACFPSIFCY